MLDVLAALSVSVLSGLGVGGGGLGVLYLVLVKGLEQRAAQGLNTVLFICASASAFLVNRKRRRIDPSAVALTVAVGCPAVLLGSFLTGIVPADTVRRLFGGFLIFLGLRAIFGRYRG